MPITIQLRRGTLSQWTVANPILASGEPGLDLTNMLLKVGDGSRDWNNLPYVSVRLSGGTGIGLSQNPDGSYAISSPLSISGIGLSRTYNNSPNGNYTLSLSTGLQSIANLNIPTNNYLYTTGTNAFSTGLITSAGRSLLASNGHTHSVSDITNFGSGVSGLLPSAIVYTTGNQNISDIKSFSNSGIFNDGIISNKGIFENLFTNSIELVGNNNKIFLTAGSGIFFTYHDQDNILEISADYSVLPVSDTIVLRDMQGDIFARNANFEDIYSNRIISTGGTNCQINSTSNIMLDASSSSATNSIGNGLGNIIIGSLNDAYGSVLYGEYPPSYDFLCFGSNNILNDSSQSFIIGNNSSSLSSNSSIAIGNNALISNSGQMSYSNGKFQYNGDSQKITYLARGVTIDDNSCVLTLDGNTISNNNIFLVPAETTWAFYGQISAYDYINGYGAAFNIRGGIRTNQFNETKLIGSFIKESWIEPEIENIYVSITANDTNKTLQLEAFGKNGSSIKWTCELNIIQNSNSGTL
jgi:hypothetical protein